MKELKERIGRSFGYFDSRTDGDLNIVKSVDITDECPDKAGGNEAVILDFTQATEGIMVNVTECYPGEDYGAGVANFLDNFENLGDDRTGSFCRFARSFGLTPEQLVEIVRREAPSIDRSKLVADFKVYATMRDGLFDDRLKKAGLEVADLAA